MANVLFRWVTAPLAECVIEIDQARHKKSQICRNSFCIGRRPISANCQSVAFLGHSRSVRIARHSPHAPAGSSVQVVPMHAAGAHLPWQAAPAAATPSGGAPAAPRDEDEGLHVITSSMVGTFYRRPGPESAPFVKEGDAIRAGQVVCVLEAMKILNEIESDVSGVLVRVCADDGQPVEFGEKLFAIRPN